MPNSTVAVDVVTDYARAVINGDILAGRWVKLACERHLRDLERQDTDDFPFVYEPELAERVADFFRFCRHVKGPLADKPIDLDLWQRFIFGSVFGWVHRGTGFRRFRKAYVQVARGNGKSTMLSPSVRGRGLKQSEGWQVREICVSPSVRGRGLKQRF